MNIVTYSRSTKTIYFALQDAKKDEGVKKAYRLLAALHEVTSALSLICSLFAILLLSFHPLLTHTPAANSLQALLSSAISSSSVNVLPYHLSLSLMLFSMCFRCPFIYIFCLHIGFSKMTLVILLSLLLEIYVHCGTSTVEEVRNYYRIIPQKDLSSITPTIWFYSRKFAQSFTQAWIKKKKTTVILQDVTIKEIFISLELKHFTHVKRDSDLEITVIGAWFYEEEVGCGQHGGEHRTMKTLDEHLGSTRPGEGLRIFPARCDECHILRRTCNMMMMVQTKLKG